MMDTASTFCGLPFDLTVRKDGFAPGIGRKLRSFDADGVAPYDYPGLVAFLKAWKLEELTTSEICVFLLLRDNPHPEGFTESDIARELEFSVPRTRTSIRGLQRKGYVLQSFISRTDEEGKVSTGWIVDPTNEWTADSALFYEFGYL